MNGQLNGPDAFERRFNVTLSFDFFLPAADFSKPAAKVQSGSNPKIKACLVTIEYFNLIKGVIFLLIKIFK